jgi:hypothetical protein
MAMDLGLQINTIFPNTVDALHGEGLSQLPNEFSVELVNLVGGQLGPESSWSHWFPAYLKIQKVKNSLLEIAEFEYLIHLVSSQDFGSTKLDKGQVQLKPGVQFVFLSQHHRKLNKTPGLYCIFKSSTVGATANLASSYLLNTFHAQLIDALHEPRKYNRSQLIDAVLEDHAVILKEEVREGVLKSYQELFDLGILVQG